MGLGWGENPNSRCDAGQTIVPGVRPPEARNDLVEVRAQLGQRVSTAFGVPSAFLNEGARFSANASCQLRAFNSTTQSLATFLNSVLSQTYDFIYGTADGQRVVVTPQQVTPLEEIVGLFTSQLVSREAVAPVAMQLVGLTKQEIEAETRRQEERARELAAQTADATTDATAVASNKREEDDAPSAPSETSTDDGEDDDATAPSSKRAKA